MANIQIEKQRQFGYKLLIIAVLIAIFFSVWYWLDKMNETSNKPAEITKTVIK